MKIQKIISAFCILIFFNILIGRLISQTPYYSVKFNLTDTSKESYIYLIKKNMFVNLIISPSYAQVITGSGRIHQL